MKSFNRLVKIIDELREKCPWDAKQTFETLRILTIEETYELNDAIINGDDQELKNELGDLLMHIVFYCNIAREKGIFEIENVLHEVCEKLIKRHPHVYKNQSLKDGDSMEKNWEKIKLKSGSKSVLQGVPNSMEPLSKATRIQQKVAAVGFDWKQSHHVLEKVKEEIVELEKEVQGKNKVKMEEEFGDVLFSLINYARFIAIDPDRALQMANKKFIDRFQTMEKLINEKKRSISDLSVDELDKYWEKSKKIKNS